jgi:hypothetical protein
MTMTTPPRRRWFQFSLATMFVGVTLTAMSISWSIWELKFVRDRQALIQRLNQDPTVGGAYPASGDIYAKTPVETIPFWRRWLGDRTIHVVVVSSDQFSQAEIQLVRRLFPEARIFEYSGFISQSMYGEIMGLTEDYAPGYSPKPNIPSP